MHRLSPLAFSLLPVLVLAEVASAQSNWLLRPVAGPSPRHSHGMAFDSVRGVTVLVGGNDGTANLAETWEWDGSSWTQRFPATSPPATNRVVFDSQRGVTVLAHNTGTWEWNGVAWTQVSTVPVGGHGIAYDPVRGRTVVLTGLGGNPITPTPAECMEWDGATWSTITSPTGPYHSIVGMAWHASTQRVVAFTAFQGLSAPPGTGPRLWSWDGVAWTSTTPGGGTYVNGGVLVSYGNGVRAYGGLSNQFPIVGLYEPPSTGTESTFANPGGRIGHALAYDSIRNRIVLFGGSFASTIGSQLRGDTWEYAGPGLAASSEPYGQGCGAPPLTLAAASGSRPVFGSTFVADVGNATPFATAVAWGVSGQSYMTTFANLPLDLAPLGMPGCQMWTGSQGLLGCTTTGGATQFVLPVPTVPSLYGVQLHLQALSFRAGANPLQMVVSNGLQLTFSNL